MSDDPLRGLDVAAVGAWIERHVDGAAGPFEFSLVAAGGSNLTYWVADDAGATYALRRPPRGTGLQSAHDMSREYRIMSALADSAVPVPRCFAFCDDHTIEGVDFYVMDFVDGLILRDRSMAEEMTREQAHAATESLVDAQIAFHTIDLAEVGLSTLGKHEDYVARQLKRWRRQVEAGGGRDVPLMRELHETMVDAIPPERYPAGLAHGDYRFDNTVLDGSTFAIAAILDWELCTTGDPIADFVWSLQYWADPADDLTWLVDPPTTPDTFAMRADVAEMYQRRSGFDLSDLAFYTGFSWWKQACIREGVLSRRAAGATGGIEHTQSTAELIEMNDALFERAAEHLKDLS